jgi:hypothetical protein
MFVHKRIGGTASAVAVAILVVWVAADLFGRGVFGSVPWAESLVDYRLLYDYSRHVVRTNAYPAGYPYPPAAVVLHWATAQLPFEASAALWAVLCGAAAVGCWLVLARLLRLDWNSGAYALLPLAHLSCAYFFQWDLRSGNCNLVFLAALLLALDRLSNGRSVSAGFWLALAFSLKLFCVLVIPYLLWKGHRRAFVWSLAFVGLFWLAVPVLVFGAGGAAEVYAGWLGQLTQAAGHASGTAHPIVTSLARSGAWLLGERGPLLVNGVRGLWLGLGLAGWWASALRGKNDAFGLLADAALLTLAPIAVSPYLEPYHPVPFAIAALLLLRAAADAGQIRRVRLLAALAFVASVAVARLPLSWEARGLLINAKLLIAVVGSVLVAHLRASTVQAVERFAGGSVVGAQRQDAPELLPGLAVPPQALQG